MIEWWWAYLLLGGFVGFFSGLLGIGGGAAMVPVLAFIFAAKQFAPDHVVHLALGTAITTIVFTSMASVLSHHRHQAVNWRIVLRVAPGIFIGTFGGALLAGFMDLRLLSVIFTVLIYYLSAQMLKERKPGPILEFPGTSIVSLVAAGIGLISSLTATGGAALVVAFLIKRGIRIHEAIGTAAAVGWPLAVAGGAGYVLSGLRVEHLPDYSIGYVYLPALAVIVLSSIIMAPIGARIAHRTPGRMLKRIFAVILFVLATSMLLRFF
ncbi:MAG: sulfite exporter TauE/SafE family protein [Burkholderiales bacterium]|nr:sulfite exporter TauE/SafE family protein [Burkholderiales bacterium]